MSVFADSSALVTRFVSDEADVVPRATAVAVSAVARVEVASALWRKVAQGALTAAQASVLLQDFEAEWFDTAARPSPYRAVSPTRPILMHAARITGTHGLRTLDAIQLASALAARDAEPECQTMVVLDERLRRAAAAERFEIVP